MKLIGALSALLCFSVVSGANILGVFTSLSPSHNIVHLSVVKALIEKGHNVTVLSRIPMNDKKLPFHHIFLPLTKEEKAEHEENMKTSNKSSLAKLMRTSSTIKKMVDLQYDPIRSPEVQNFLKSGVKVDAVILGYFFNDVYLALAAQLKAPVLMSWTAAPFLFSNSFVGNPTEFSYVPNLMITSETKMGFFARVINTIATGGFSLVEAFANYKLSQYYDEYVQEFNLKDMPSFDDMRKNVSLVFCNSHFSEGPIRPNVPAIVEIGGIQIKDKPDPLEPKLKEFLDNSSKHGAILFSMGSNVKVSTLDPKIIKTLYNVFSKLKQNVLWKWEDPNPASFPGNSKNILFSKWIPQDDVLAHKNMKLFVTHGGKGSVVESQYHGIPMIGLPVFGDQPGNIDKIVKVGYGLKLDYKTMTEQELSTAVNEVLNNPSYAANVKKFADTYKDRPLSARESVVFWTEYVIRHHGAPHLQSPLVHMNVIQQYSIDVLAVIFGALYIVYRISKLCICFVWRKVFGKKCKSKAKAKKSKKE
ncbi:hypothetical protein ACFFRR_010948 [Megaselia abdita]